MRLRTLAFRLRRRRVRVVRFNTLLDDAARAHYGPSIDALWMTVPEMMRRKIERANVQQGFMLAAVEQLVRFRNGHKMLCVGAFEDTACAALQALGYRVDTLDPATDMDLASYRRAYPERVGSYPLVFSTSVIEHVPDDEAFVADISAMLAPRGYAVLTCDYRDGWTPDQLKPSSDVRIYTRADMDRLVSAMRNVELLDVPDWHKHEPDFTFSELGLDILYGFATLTVRRTA